MKARYITLCMTSIALGCGGALGGDGSPKPPPATVENRVNETDLTTVKLTAAAEQRLGITVASVERRSLARPLRFPGEVLIPPGKALVVSAPVAGLVTMPAAVASPLSAGLMVESGRPVLRLSPGEFGDGRTFVPADRISLARARADLTSARVEAEGLLEQARVRAQAAQVKLDRADQLRQQGAGAQRAFDEAQAERDLAQSEQNAAEARVAILDTVLASLESGASSAIPIAAPLTGQVRTVYAAPGEIVAGGAPLFEVVALDPVWVRAPVYVGDLSSVEAAHAARVCGLTEAPGARSREAQRVAWPGTADPRSATVDLYFELANPDAALRPGQRVMVEMAGAAARETTVVPFAAVLFDIYGGAWVYERIAPQQYARRRITIRDVIGNMAIIDDALPIGAQVVTAGAAELFGTEFGAGK